MEGPELTSPASPTRDQPAPAPGPPGTPVRQASPHLTVGPIILPPEQGLAPTVFLKALPIPLYHTVPPGGLQPRAPLVTGSLDGGSMPFILSTLLQPEGPGPTQVGKPATPTLTVNLVRAPPVLSPGLGPTPGSLAKVRSSGKYLCPHCSRDCLKPSVLEKHLRSHTGERPFPCATCGIAFKTQSNLYKHRRTQTHLSNSRLSSESEGAGSGPLEDGGQAGGPPRAAGKGDSRSPGGDNGARPERPLSPGIQGTHLSPTARGLEPKLEAVPSPGSTFADREAPLDPTHTASAGLPQAGSQPRHKRPEQTSPTASRICSVQQQPPTFSEKPRDTKAAEGRLRKCGSTDSGYLSRSDSAEQPPAPGSPLHSLSEHSAESEGEGAPGPGGTKAARGGRGPGLELGKRQLEERIARLISHNQAVVDDPQLDHVRPRKTVLSKQGSIDLPVPYTYKDSFHFEIRAPEPGRSRHGALGTARSTCTPLDKTRPLFFHSVPTQLSTGVECVPVTRSNSLPFVEGARTWQESPDPPDSCPRKQKPLSPRPPPTRLVGVPSGHPRALVRQAAVEDLPCPPTGETTAPMEDPDGKRAVAGDGAAGRGKAAGRKCSPRKPQMFSQEKWQVYGHETFQRIYQKMKTSHQGGRKAKEATVGRRTETDLSHQGEALQGECTAPSQDRGTPVSGGTSAGAKPGLWESLPATEGFLVTESPKQRETVARAGGSDQPRVSRAMSPSTLGLREPSCFGSKSPVLPPDGRTELACPLSPVSGPLEGGDLGAPRPLLPDPKLEGGTGDGGDAKEPCHSGLTVPRLPSDSSGEPQPAGAKLSSEWKKLRVEPSRTLGAGGQTPGGPVQATPPPAGSQDLDPGEEPGGLHSSADCLEKGRPRLLEVSGASFSDPLVALRPVGLRDKAPVLRPAAGAPGGHYQPAAQTRVPSTPVALTDTAFPPKYLLRVRQGETLPPPSGSQGPGGVQDPLRRSEYPVEPAPSVESGLGTPLPPCPAMGLAPGGTDNFGEDSSWPRPWGRGNGVLGEEKGGLDASIPATEESPSLSTGDPREMASNLSTVTCDSRKTETHHTGHLWVGSTWVRGWPTGGVLTPQALNRDVEGSPETIREDPPPGLLAGHSPCGSLRPSPVLSALPALGWPELASCARSESPGSCGPQGPFPSLRAEPRLTWCCLSRSLPLPMERKEKSASAGWVQPCLGDGSPDHGAGPRPESKAVAGQWTRTRPAEGGQTQPWKLPCPAAPGMTTQDPGSEPERKKGPPRRRAKVSRGSGKKTKLRRFRGNLLQSRVQLRAGRRRKSLWVLRKACDASPLEGLNPHGTVGQAPSGMAGLHLRQELPCATSALSLGHGNGDEEEEEDQSPVSGSIYPGARPGTVRERDALAVKGIMPSAGELGDCCPQNSAVPLGSSLSPASCVQAANDSLLSCDQGLDLGLPENWLQPPQEQVPAGPQPRVFPDAEQHSSFESKGNSPRRDSATSVAVLCTSLGASGGHTPLGTPSVESPDHGQVAGKAPTQTSLAGKAAVQGTSPALLPGKPSPGQGLSGLASLGSPSSGPGSASLHQEEGRPKTGFPPQGQHGCGEGLATGPPSGAGSDKGQESGLLALEGRVFPSKPGQLTGVPEAPSKTTKRRSLEGMRKQARVEFSDTSSDDEDRLVIEI